MLKVKIFVVWLSLFVVSSAYAVDYNIQVCDLQSHSNVNHAYLKPCGEWASKNSCGDTYVTWNMNSFQGKAMYTTALAALLADKEVRVRMAPGCSAGYDVISMVRIKTSQQ